MVRIPFSAFTWVSAARETWDLKCLPCDETNKKGGPKTQKDRQAQCHQRTPVTISFMSNSSGKRIMPTTRQCCLGVLTARMTQTAQAGRKSWHVSAPRGREGGKRNEGEETLSQWPRGLLIKLHHTSLHYIPTCHVQIITVVIPSRASQLPLIMFRTGSVDEDSFIQSPAKCQERRCGWILHFQEGVTNAACGP